MDSKKPGYNGMFWSLGVAGIAALLGSAYYIYSLLNQEEDLSEEDLQQIKDLRQELGQESGQQALTVETAVQIMSLTNKISEEMVKKMKPDFDDRRRAAINNNEEYERVCQEGFETKEFAYNEALKKVLTQFGDISLEEIHKLMQTIPPMQIEQINHKYEKHILDGMSVPDRALVKEAFIYYGKKFNLEMREFQKIFTQQTSFDPTQDQYFFFRLLTTKMKVDDELFLKYNYTEPQIKYMLYEYNLMEDPDVKRVTEQLMRFDQMLVSPEEQ